MDKETKDYVDRKTLHLANVIQETFNQISRDIANLRNRVKKLEDN